MRNTSSESANWQKSVAPRIETGHNDAKRINKRHMLMPTPAGPNWKGPTVRDIAELSRFAPATVDRALNGRPGVRDATRERILAAHRKLSQASNATPPLQVDLMCESGVTFNRAVETAADTINRTYPGVAIKDDYTETSKFDPGEFSKRICEIGNEAGGLILVAREHPSVNNAVRGLRRRGIPVVCLTTDLPSSRRSAYVGNDQHAAGSVAAQLIGNALSRVQQNVLLVVSVAFRCQQEREMGFRRVLRSTFPHLRIVERVISDEIPETTYEQLSSFFETKGLPSAIYNVAGANRGIAQALEESEAAESTIFVGHELTPVSQGLLESGTMDYVISHDFNAELRTAVQWIDAFHNGVEGDPGPTPILLHTRYNCGP